MLNQTLYVKEMCMSGCFTISFFLVIQSGVCLSHVGYHCYQPPLGTHLTSEQCNRDLM